MDKFFNWLSCSPRCTTLLIVLTFVVGLFLFSPAGCSSTPPRAAPPPATEGPVLVACVPMSMVIIFVREGDSTLQYTQEPGCRCVYKFRGEKLIHMQPANDKHPECRIPPQVYKGKEEYTF